MRGPGALVLALVVTFLAVPAAGAAEETCHGLRATIVGEPGASIEGTGGPDVIVSNGAAYVGAGAGADLLCVTGTRDRVDLSGDAGDDTIDTTATTATTFAFLSTGDDIYIGGAGDDHVQANQLRSGDVHPARSSESNRGQGADTVSTGAGDDSVSTGGGLSHPDGDTIDVGAGDDRVQVDGPVDPALRIEAGAGEKDLLRLAEIMFTRALVIDNVAQSAAVNGDPTVSWAGFDDFSLDATSPWEPPAFIGGPGSEDLFSTIPLTSVDLGAGDDVLELALHHWRALEASFDAGSGDDRFLVYGYPSLLYPRSLDLDLTAERLAMTRSGPGVRADFTGFDHVDMWARRARITGTGRADDVDWSGCRATIRTGGGDDVVRARALDEYQCGSEPTDRRAAIRGGAGDDLLTGGEGADVLIGGIGQDRADGGPGRDRCDAEVVRRCE